MLEIILIILSTILCIILTFILLAIFALRSIDITIKQFIEYIEAINNFKILDIDRKAILEFLDKYGYERLMSDRSAKMYITAFMLMTRKSLEALAPIPVMLYQEEKPIIDNVRDLYCKINLLERGLVRS